MKFIFNFSIIAQPLSGLLKKNIDFYFSEEQEITFNELKRDLSSKPVFRIYNQKSTTELHTDASIHGYGCILFQISPADDCFHPENVMSKKTTDAEKGIE